MLKFNPNDHPHTRFNPLRNEWVLVSPHRMKRPWQGQVEKVETEKVKRHDPTNPLCPGVKRGNGIVNPNYEETFLFDNDFPALFDYSIEDEPQETQSDDVKSDLFKVFPAKGSCKVMCFHPFSDLTMSTMKIDEIKNVINKWLEILEELSPKYEWVQIFENKGAIMGCSNPHPHCQIWCSNFLPNNISIEDRNQLEFYNKHGKVMLVEYVKHELEMRERIVVENEDWVVLVPYWAIWPYETMLLPKRHIVRMQDVTQNEVTTLADIMKRILVKYDNLFECSFPYSMGFHFAPLGKHLKNECKHWLFHASYLPPLLRSSTVKKHMVGYELLAQQQRDLTPEQAAAKLRELSDTDHYSNREKAEH